MSIKSALCLTAAFWTAVPLAAQEVLDQTEPTQAQDEPNVTGKRGEAAPRILPTRSPDIRAPDGVAGSLAISSIVIEGNAALPDTNFVDLIAQYTARTVSREDLAALADAIAARARSEGYIFATVTIPPQRLDLGILRIILDEGRIDAIDIDGDDDPAIRRQLEPLLSGVPVTRAELERRLLLADDVSGVRILDARYEKEGSIGRLLVRTRRSRARAEIEIRNNGSEPVGPTRARVELDFNGLIDAADEVDLTFGITPLEPDELQFARGSYRWIASPSGLELGTNFSYSETEPGAFLADRDITGRFWRIGAEARYPLIRRRDASVWLIGSFDLTDLRQTRFGEIARHDRVPAIRAEIYSRGEFAGGDFRARVTASRGLDIFDATDPGDPLASRSDASARFSSLYAWFAWERPILGDISVAIGGRGQIAADPLLATEDIGLGGTTFLRGYRFNERTGDRGIMGYGEFRYDWSGDGDWFRSAQLYGYADGGTVSNLEDGRGGGSLASAGAGVRLDVTRDLELDLELAVPLSGPRFDSDSATPLINVRIEQSF